jgi:hypothetical protein
MLLLHVKPFVLGYHWALGRLRRVQPDLEDDRPPGASGLGDIYHRNEVAALRQLSRSKAAVARP